MFPDQSFNIQAISVPSEVHDQPQSNHEALLGAENRARNAKIEAPHADYWIGIEGGVEKLEWGLSAFAWIVIISGSKIGKSRTGTFFLPQAVADLVNQGKELGDADDMVFGQTNSKQNQGAVGLLTSDAIDRTNFYTEAVILALIPFKNPDLYPG